jgi:hypothetical protein
MKNSLTGSLLLPFIHYGMIADNQIQEKTKIEIQSKIVEFSSEGVGFRIDPSIFSKAIKS